MIDPQITRRFLSEAAFQEEKLRNLFRVIYRDEGEAWETWQTQCNKRGFKRASEALRTKPARFGKLKGKARLGFLKDQAFEAREQALSEAIRQAERWNVAQMQLDQHEARMVEEEDLSRPKPQARYNQRDKSWEQER